MKVRYALFLVVAMILQAGDYQGGPLDEWLEGGPGDDCLMLGAGADMGFGNEGDDLVCGEAGSDTLFGNDGDDILFGAEIFAPGDTSSNQFTGGLGDDLLVGGNYGDFYYYNPGDGFDTIRETGTLPGQFDRVVFSPEIKASKLGFSRDKGDLYIEFCGEDILRIESWFGSSAGNYQIEGFQFGDGPVLPGASLRFDGITWDGTAAADRYTALGGVCFRLRGADGADILTGATGMDVVLGGAGNDQLSGADGNDGVYGEDGSDTLRGDNGDDDLYGGSGNDLLSGGNGADLLVGDAGDDLCYGDAGNDTYQWNPGDGNDQIIDTTNESGSAIDNRLVFGPGITKSNITVSVAGSTGLKLAVKDAMGAAAGSATINSWYSYVSGGVQHRQVWRIIFSDGTSWDGETMATPGDDVIAGGSENDTLSGSDGNDTLTGNAGNDTLAGDAGGDSLNGNAGDDFLDGGTGADLLVGGTGNDTLRGGTGDDAIYGDGGNDNYLWNTGDGNDLLIDSTNEYTGVENHLVFGPGIIPGDVTTEKTGSNLKLTVKGQTGLPVGSLTIFSWYANVTGTVRHAHVWKIIFADGTIWNGKTLGTTGDDALVGTEENDYIAGLGGSDTITGNGGGDLLAGNEGSDTINGGTGNDTLEGGPDSDALYGNANDDLLRGGTGQDFLYGGENNDTLSGGPDDDFLYGEAGNDIYQWEIGDGNDQVQDSTWEFGPGVENRLLFGPGITPANIELATVGATSLKFTVRDGSGAVLGSATINSWFAAVSGSILHRHAWVIAFADGTLWNGGTLATPGADVISGSIGNDILSGGAGSDTLSGNDGNDSLSGDDGSDLIFGNNGNDSLNGGSGDDTLYGGTGADILAGNAGNDILNGESGADFYVWSVGDGNDLITETFVDAAVDNTLQIRGVANVGAIDFAREGETKLLVKIISGATPLEESIGIANWSAPFGSAMFLNHWLLSVENSGTFRFANRPDSSGNTVVGTSANDLLIGLGGDDVLSGGAGADLIVGGTGNDSLDGNDGADLFVGGTGDDILSGGDGNDRYFINLGGGADVIIEPLGQSLGEDNDLVFGAGILPESLVVSRANNDLLITFGTGIDSVRVQGWFAANDRSSALETIIFANGAVWPRQFVESRIGAVGSGDEPFVVDLIAVDEVNEAIGNSPAAVPAFEILTPLEAIVPALAD